MTMGGVWDWFCLCQVAGFGSKGFEPSVSATTTLVS
jgi:hypothetical protein